MSNELLRKYIYIKPEHISKYNIDGGRVLGQFGNLLVVSNHLIHYYVDIEHIK
jgi:hypothetical protein